jgi:hypothetical protein
LAYSKDIARTYALKNDLAYYAKAVSTQGKRFILLARPLKCKISFSHPKLKNNHFKKGFEFFQIP